MRWSMIWEGRKAWWSLTVVRNMGGGPRTFPGGVNKWKWKRMHEKRAREKEKRLIDQEKQLYEARIRSHIRSTISPDSSSTATATHRPMGPHDHIKALADRFMKEGAQDLWNDDDGPQTLTPTTTLSPPVDLRKLISKPTNRNLTNYVQSRDYRSVPEVRNVADHHRLGGNKRRFWRNDGDSSSGESENECEIESESYHTGSSASLGKYDVKREKRVIPKSYEEESDLSKQVELIKLQLKERRLIQNEEEHQGQGEEQETILSQTRYAFGIREILCLR